VKFDAVHTNISATEHSIYFKINPFHGMF